MSRHHVKIEVPGPSTRPTHVYLDGHKVKGVRRVEIELKMGSPPIIHLDILPDKLDYDGPAEVYTDLLDMNAGEDS